MYLDSLLKRHQFASMTGEHFSNLERLRQESLDLTGTSYCQLVVFRQLVHTQDGNDILHQNKKGLYKKEISTDRIAS